MNTQQQSKKESEVYSISGFKDTLASPVFYPVIVVALVLGITSIFGFVQNPLKLKSMVNVIQQKVAERNVVNDSFSSPRYVADYASEKNNEIERIQAATDLNTFYSFESNANSNASQKMPIEGDFERIVFNYDITSESFWTDLDSSKLETAEEEMIRKEKEAATYGAPLQIEYQESLPADFNIQDDSIYAINNLSKL